MKTLQHNDRVRHEDKMKLVYSLSRYFNNEKETKSQENIRKSPSRPQLKGDNTFLFLKVSCSTFQNLYYSPHRCPTIEGRNRIDAYQSMSGLCQVISRL